MDDLRLLAIALAVNIGAAACVGFPFVFAIDHLLFLPTLVLASASMAWLLSIGYVANMIVLRRMVGD